MRISVVIPCHNAEPYLAEAVESVLAQTRPPEQVIVVDDGSTDRSLEIAESFGERVRVLSKQSGSATRTRNYGASVAEGDALMFLDADDALGPTALEALMAELEQDEGSIAACPWFRLELDADQWVRCPASCPPRRRGDDPLDGWLRGWYHPPCSVLWSRAAFDRAGGWDPEVLVNQDGDLMMRAFVLGTPLRITDAGEAFYRRVPAGTASLSGKRNTEAGLRSRLEVIRRIAEMLAERQALDPHRAALADAFDQIASDCGDRYPDLKSACREQRRLYGDPEVKRLVRVIERTLRTGYRSTRDWCLGRAMDGRRPSACQQPEPLEQSAPAVSVGANQRDDL